MHTHFHEDIYMLGETEQSRAQSTGPPLFLSSSLPPPPFHGRLWHIESRDIYIDNMVGREHNTNTHTQSACSFSICRDSG